MELFSATSRYWSQKEVCEHIDDPGGPPERAGSSRHLSFSEMLMRLSTLGSFFPLA